MARPVFATPDDAAYTPAIERLLPSDPASADSVFNPLLQRIITNVHTAYLQGVRNGEEIGRVRDGIGGGLYKAVRVTGNPIRAVSGAYPLQALQLLGSLPAGIHTVHVCGNNYFDVGAPHSTNPEIATLTTLNGVVSVQTKATVAGYRDVTYPGTIQLMPGAEYTLSMLLAINGTGGDTQRGDIRIGKADGTLIKFLPGEAEDGVYSKSTTFTAPEDGKVKIALRYHNTAALDLPAGITVSWRDIMLSADGLPYEPYQGAQYIVTATTDIAEGGSLSVPDAIGVNGDNNIVNSADAQMEAVFAPPVPMIIDAVTDCANAISGLVTTIPLTTLNGWSNIGGSLRLTIIAGEMGVISGRVKSPDNGQSLDAVPTGVPLAVLPAEYKPAAITYAMGVRDNGIYATGDAMVNTSAIAGGVNLYAYGTAANPLPPKTSVSIQLIYLI